MEGIIGTLEFYAPVLVLGVIVIGIVYFMKKRKRSQINQHQPIPEKGIGFFIT